MEVAVDDVFFIREAGLAAFAVSVDPPSAEVKKGWYMLEINGAPLEKLWIEGEGSMSPNTTQFRLISTKDLDKVSAHAFAKNLWKLKPVK